MRHAEWRTIQYVAPGTATPLTTALKARDNPRTAFLPTTSHVALLQSDREVAAAYQGRRLSWRGRDRRLATLACAFGEVESPFRDAQEDWQRGEVIDRCTTGLMLKTLVS